MKNITPASTRASRGFYTKMKIRLGVVQKLGVLVEEGSEELVPLIDGGEVLNVYDGVLFHQPLVDVPHGAYLDHSYA